MIKLPSKAKLILKDDGMKEADPTETNHEGTRLAKSNLAR